MTRTSTVSRPIGSIFRSVNASPLVYPVSPRDRESDHRPIVSEPFFVASPHDCPTSHTTPGLPSNSLQCRTDDRCHCHYRSSPRVRDADHSYFVSEPSLVASHHDRSTSRSAPFSPPISPPSRTNDHHSRRYRSSPRARQSDRSNFLNELIPAVALPPRISTHSAPISRPIVILSGTNCAVDRSYPSGHRARESDRSEAIFGPYGTAALRAYAASSLPSSRRPTTALRHAPRPLRLRSRCCVVQMTVSVVPTNRATLRVKPTAETATTTRPPLSRPRPESRFVVRPPFVRSLPRVEETTLSIATASGAIARANRTTDKRSTNLTALQHPEPQPRRALPPVPLSTRYLHTANIRPTS